MLFAYLISKLWTNFAEKAKEIRILLFLEIFAASTAANPVLSYDHFTNLFPLLADQEILQNLVDFRLGNFTFCFKQC